MASTSPAPVSSIISSSPSRRWPSSSDKSLWRSQTVPIAITITIICLPTGGHLRTLPGGGIDFENGRMDGRQRASRGWHHHRSSIVILIILIILILITHCFYALSLLRPAVRLAGGPFHHQRPGGLPAMAAGGSLHHQRPRMARLGRRRLSSPSAPLDGPPWRPEALSTISIASDGLLWRPASLFTISIGLGWPDLDLSLFSSSAAGGSLHHRRPRMASSGRRRLSSASDGPPWSAGGSLQLSTSPWIIAGHPGFAGLLIR
ncbi:hypothetical protein TYRP_009377 [Tyrophagus putrescentiae]|nr:hypothetical protein TYRP_009377 [Tyrophagus putrescentiae]